MSSESRRHRAEVWRVDSDPYPDLVAVVMARPDHWPPESKVATVTGSLRDGTPFRGEDPICFRR